MSRLIPNENTWVAFGVTTPTSLAAPTAANITAAIKLTGYLMSINASARGNTVPTPNFETLFETSVSGTVQASFDADFYRDDEEDTAWETLPRGTEGCFYISRFGGSGANNTPEAGDDVEVWPVVVVSRTMANMSSNTIMSFSISCSVPSEPEENGVVGS